jgi:hypothetical protein
MGLIMVGLTVVQFLLVGGYLALVERGTKRSELVGFLLAVLLVTMWWLCIPALGSLPLYHLYGVPTPYGVD